MTPTQIPVPDQGSPSTALLTDKYELTMLQGALRAGTAQRRCVFELFGRKLPASRRYGVVAGTGRLLDAVEAFTFTPAQIDFLRATEVVDDATLDYLRDYRFSGTIRGYAEGECYFSGSPLLTVEGTFAEACILETLALSIYNYDCAVAAAASRMTIAAHGRPCVEFGARRAHEHAAVSAARAAVVGGFAGTSDLEAGMRYGIPTVGTSAHSFTLLHDTEEEAFAAQVASLGPGTTILVDTYDITRGIERAVAAARAGGGELGAVRLDSGDLVAEAFKARAQLDALGATSTKITVTNDLDEYAIAGLGAAPDLTGAQGVLEDLGRQLADLVACWEDRGGDPDDGDCGLGERLREACSTLGRDVVVDTSSGRVRGRAVDLRPGLVLHDAVGGPAGRGADEIVISAGDVASARLRDASAGRS